MSEEAKPRGRAVAEKATITFLTLPDGSKRRVASRPVGDPGLIYNWLIEEAGDNPNRWFDFRDLYRFVYGGEPMRISHQVKKTLRSFIRGARRYAMDHDDILVVKLDGHGGAWGGVTHFKIWNRENVKETKAAIDGATKDLGMQEAFQRRVEQQCQTLGTDHEQLEAILRVWRNRKPPEEAAAS